MPLHELDTRFVNFRDPVDFSKSTWYRPEEFCHREPKREVYCQDALVWLQELESYGPNSSVFTSIPDISELPEFINNNRVQEYKEWFTKVSYLLFSKLEENNAIVFLQTDSKVLNKSSEIIEWIDKFFLLSYAANLMNCTLLWHKLVSLKDLTVLKKNCGRPHYSHLACFVKNSSDNSRPIFIDTSSPLDFSFPTTKSSENNNKNSTKFGFKPGNFRVPDMFFRGEMLWQRGIGLNSCYIGTIFLRDVMKATRIIDPFCGVGTALAMANILGVDSVGVELSAKRCKKAKLLTIAECLMENVPTYLRDVTVEDEDEGDDSESDKKKKKKKNKADRKKAQQRENDEKKSIIVTEKEKTIEITEEDNEVTQVESSPSHQPEESKESITILYASSDEES